MNGLWKVEDGESYSVTTQNSVRDSSADPCIRCGAAGAMLGESPALSWTSHS